MTMGLVRFLFAAALVGCKPSDQITLGADVAHANGLLAAAPEGWEVQATTSGFVFAEPGDLRSPGAIRLDLVSEPPDLAGLHRRGWGVWGSERVNYQVREDDGGSGGTEYELTAVRALSGRHLVLTATDQSEGAPGFSAAWATLEHAVVE